MMLWLIMGYKLDGNSEFTLGGMSLLSNLTLGIIYVLITWDLMYTVNFGYHKPN